MLQNDEKTPLINRILFGMSASFSSPVFWLIFRGYVSFRDATACLISHYLFHIAILIICTQLYTVHWFWILLFISTCILMLLCFLVLYFYVGFREDPHWMGKKAQTAEQPMEVTEGSINSITINRNQHVDLFE